MITVNEYLVSQPMLYLPPDWPSSDRPPPTLHRNTKQETSYNSPIPSQWINCFPAAVIPPCLLTTPKFSSMCTQSRPLRAFEGWLLHLDQVHLESKWINTTNFPSMFTWSALPHTSLNLHDHCLQVYHLARLIYTPHVYLYIHMMSGSRCIMNFVRVPSTGGADRLQLDVYLSSQMKLKSQYIIFKMV